MYGISAVKDLDVNYYAVLEEDVIVDEREKDLLDFDLAPCNDSELAILRSYLHEPRFHKFLRTAKPKERYEDVGNDIMLTKLNGDVIGINVIKHTPISVIQRAVK